MVDKKNYDVMFSVEVLTYNQKDYIAQTLQSILDQKHNYKYEILVSDDCSTDGTQNVIREFAEKYSDIIKPVYNVKNIGAMANYYATVARAKGKYLMGCAGDDYWLPGKVEKQISFMERNLDFDVCYGFADVFDEKLNSFSSTLGGNYLNFQDLMNQGNHIPALTLCIRKVFFDKYLTEIQPQKKDWQMEDYPFLIYAAFESYIYYINNKFAVYRIIEKSISHQIDIDKRISFEKSVYDIKNFFANRYRLSISLWNENEERKKIMEIEEQKKINEREKSKKINNLLKKNKTFIMIRKIIKIFVPYGIILLLRKNK